MENVSRFEKLGTAMVFADYRWSLASGDHVCLAGNFLDRRFVVATRSSGAPII